MSLKAADEGLKKKLEEVYPNVVFAPAERAFEVSADSSDNVIIADSTNPEGEAKSESADYWVDEEGNTHGDAVQAVPYTYKGKGWDRHQHQVVKLPMIAFDRIENPYADDYNVVDVMHRYGPYFSDEQARELSFGTNLTYQIDIISDRRVDVDEIWRELTIVLLKNNSVSVEYDTEGQKLVEDYPLMIQSTEFSRDVSSFFDRGVIYRQTIVVQVTNVRMLFTKKSRLIEEVPLRVVPYKVLSLEEVENNKEDKDV